MSNAKTYSVGNNTFPQKRKGTQTLSSLGGVRKLDAEAKRCAGNQKGQKKVRSHSYVANGFLRTSFLPKYRETEITRVSRKSAKLERDFFESLFKLTEHYSIEISKIDQLEFPYSIFLTLANVKKQLKNTVNNWSDIRLVQDKEKTYLISEERYDSGSTLFYIPVFPLYKMLHDRDRRKTATLLLSVFSYLYHVADIPYYRQQESYLYWEYEMLKDWMLDDEIQDGEKDKRLDEMNISEWVGDNIEKKIYHQNNLTFFQHRIDHFKPKDQLDRDCLLVAEKILSLYKTYPTATIFRNASSLIDTDNDDVSEEIISMDRYISFYADNVGWLSSTLFEMVNNEFQEFSDTQEPVIEKRFDGNDMEGKDLLFESSLFDLLHDIIDLLNEYRKLSNEKY